MNKNLIIIPTYNPTIELLTYVEDLIVAGFDSILIIEDGYNKSSKKLMYALEEKKEVTILCHAINLGKGRALKNGFNYFLNMSDVEQWNGVITVDSDGQHRVEDVIKVSEELKNRDNNIVLGSRNFNNDSVPFKSKFGNKLTKNIFTLLFGKKINDTQTGLRGISREVLPFIIQLEGERFNYETNVLIHSVKNKYKITEVQIKTIYIEENKETNFDAVTDSIAIYSLIFSSFIKFFAASFISFLLDVSLFYLIVNFINPFSVIMNIFFATFISRVISSLFNYTVNKHLVFRSKKKISRTIWRYFTLVIVQLLISALIVSILYKITGASETFLKLIVDGLLFFISYRIQKTHVF